MNGKTLAKISCLAAFALWAWLLVHKYYSLGYYDWDFAFFAQAMYSLSHGSAHVSLFDINFFSNHANLIALILVPLYMIFPHPLSLLILKLISFFVASYILYLLAEEKLGPKISLIILFLYWLYPFNIYGLAYEFDFENLAPAFILLSFYCYTKNYWFPFIVSSVFLILIKENMPLIVIAFGLHGLLTRSNKLSWGLFPIILGGFSLYALAFIFVPLMGGHALGHHPYSNNYADLNLPHVLSFGKIKWLIYLFGPLPLSLLSPGTLFLGLPIIMQHLLSNVRQEHALDYSYSLTITPFIFLAFINTLGWIRKRSVKKSVYLVLSISFFFNVIFLLSQKDHIKTRYMDSNSLATCPQGWQLLRMIPPHEPVVATFRFLPVLSQRPYVYSFHKIYDPDFPYPFKLPENVHYALIDFNDAWLSEMLNEKKQATRSKIKDFLVQGTWKVKSAATNIVLFER